MELEHTLLNIVSMEQLLYNLLITENCYNYPKNIYLIRQVQEKSNWSIKSSVNFYLSMTFWLDFFLLIAGKNL